MRSMPIVLVDPKGEMTESISGVLIEASIGPLADRGLDKTLGFAVRAWGVDASTDGFDVELATGMGKQQRAEAGAVVGHDAADMNAEAGEVSDGLAQEAAGRDGLFIGQHGGESDAGVVVDSDVEELPTGAASFILRIAGDAMPGFMDTGQLFDVDVQQIAGSGMFVADDGRSGLEHTDLVQAQSGQDAALRWNDSVRWPARCECRSSVPGADPGRAPSVRVQHTSRRSMRPRAAIPQTGTALLTETRHPLGRALPTELELGRGLLQAQPAAHHSLGKFLSTMNRQSRMMVIVHSVSWIAFARNISFPVLDRMDNNLLKLHI